MTGAAGRGDNELPAAGSRQPAAAIHLIDIHKSFGPVLANRGANLEVARGSIHALVGENGAGKSTLMRVASGMYRPEAGREEVNGRDVTGWTTAQAIEAGLGMVHQHFMLVPTLTVAENILLGNELTNRGTIDRAESERAVTLLCERTGLAVHPHRLVSDLSVGEAQRVEILKALYRGAKILILDEPTAVLSPPEVKELWVVLRRMRDAGETIVLITHKLDEVMEASDSITVMRAGETVERMKTSETSPKEIAKAMVGRDVKLAADGFVEGLPAFSSRLQAADGRQPTAVLTLDHVTVLDSRNRAAVSDLSLAVNAGEILGIAGVEGNGQTELIEAIAGLRPVQTGRIMLGVSDITRLAVRERADAGLSHIPEDRHERGLILDYSIADNLILGRQSLYASRLGLDSDSIAANASEAIERFDIRPPNPNAPARALSGGNQQKIVIAREMGREFQVLLASQPTRGVDVGAIEFIHAQLRAARDAGKAILLVSADLAEVLALSDRIAVMFGGKFAVVLPRAQVTAELLGNYMTGASKAA